MPTFQTGSWGRNELPHTPYERALLLQNELISQATGAFASEETYATLRREFMDRVDTHHLLPPFMRTCRDLSSFWAYIKCERATYAERRTLIRDAFVSLLDHLEGRGRSPIDHEAADVLLSFDEEGVHHIWARALERRKSDPEGAVTMARTLLETVCKRVLDERDVQYGDEPLPALYFKVAQTLNLAPSQHTEQVFKAILGSCQTLVNNLGELRNKIGDAHGKGGRPVRPAPRHAALAVNLAGALATYLVETFVAQNKGQRS